MAKLEGNTLTYAEAETVIYGTSVAGKKMFELHQIEHIRDAWNELIEQVRNNSFNYSKYNFCNINYIVAEDENHDSRGGFRKDNVAISGTDYIPPLPIELDAIFNEMIERVEKLSADVKAIDIFMEASKNQFFGDGNKRTAQLIMNGILMMNGYAPISINPKNETEYRDNLIRYYETGEKESFRTFLLSQQAKIMHRFRIDSISEKEIIESASTKRVR
jgi:Fic family protein